VVVEVDNQSPADRTLALVRLDDGVSRLPTVGGRVPLGGAGKLTYRGDGYTVVSKLDPIRRFRHGRPGSRAVLHVFLKPGRHVLVDVGAGRYDQGKAVVITTT
jgi:hypothetical protein